MCPVFSGLAPTAVLLAVNVSEAGGGRLSRRAGNVITARRVGLPVRALLQLCRFIGQIQVTYTRHERNTDNYFTVQRWYVSTDKLCYSFRISSRR